MKILVASGFFESELPSYREYAYCKGLSARGHQVTLMCGDQSHIWKWRSFGLPVTNPAAKDEEYVRETGVQVLRRHVWFRYSDFVIYRPVLKAIKDADVVHLIEFRTGTTPLIAAIAKLMGKPVVYDHEQRGDRRRHWTSRVDSVWRRQLIRFGSMFVDHVRHTVIQNLRHFRSCSRSSAPTQLAPLGADPKLFAYDPQRRAALRVQHGIGANEKVFVMSGKLHPLKLVDQVILAARKAGVRLLLVGTLTDEMKPAIAQLPPGNEIFVPPVDAANLAGYYSCADAAIFTTFTLSYWEAYTTGLSLVVPRTDFSELVFKDDRHVELFGSEAMFLVPDEAYEPGVCIVDVLAEAMSRVQLHPCRMSTDKFSSEFQIGQLEETYRSLVRA